MSWAVTGLFVVGRPPEDADEVSPPGRAGAPTGGSALLRPAPAPSTDEPAEPIAATATPPRARQASTAPNVAFTGRPARRSAGQPPVVPVSGTRPVYVRAAGVPEGGHGPLLGCGVEIACAQD